MLREKKQNKSKLESKSENKEKLRFKLLEIRGRDGKARKVN
jgi:hypothetical protein